MHLWNFRRKAKEKSSNGAYYFPFHTQMIPLNTDTHTNSTSDQATTVWPPNLPEWHLSPDTPQPGRIGFHGGGMLHHLVHRHHQEDDIDLSKQMYWGVNRLHSERHPVPVANTRSCVSHWLMAALEYCLIYGGLGSTASANTSIPLPRGIWKFNASVRIIKYTDFQEKK